MANVEKAGIGPAAFTFLRELAANNERAWFLANKPRYERDVVLPFRQVLAALITTLAAKKIPLSGDPAKAIFRIHRDVRFSHDKLPYKTHAGAVLTRDGSKGKSGLLYIHIDPAGCFVAAGFWQPEKEALGALREAIYTDTKRFDAVQAGLAAAGLGLDDSESLVRMPRGFEDAAGSDIAAALRLKSFVVRRPLSAAVLADPVPAITNFAADALPLLEFGWKALTVLEPKRKP
jgi:uncharacterized protein (TIGR02453 family)